MQITFTRNRLRSIIEAIDEGRYITCPNEGEASWDDSELLAVAGTCLAHLMCRREVLQRGTTDEPLQFDLRRPFHRLSARMTKALNYALTAASNILNDCVPDEEDKTYLIEISYEGPEFLYTRVRPDDAEAEFDEEVDEEDEAAEADDETSASCSAPPESDNESSSGEDASDGNAVMQTEE